MFYEDMLAKNATDFSREELVLRLAVKEGMEGVQRSELQSRGAIDRLYYVTFGLEEDQDTLTYVK